MNRFRVFVVFFFTVLAFVVFRCAIGSDNSFMASDINIANITLYRRNFVDLFRCTFIDSYLLGNVSAPSCSVYIFIWSIIPPEIFNDIIGPLYLILSSLFLFKYLRTMGVGREGALFGSISAFWLGSITLTAAGHYGKLGAAMFFALSLLLVEKSIRSNGWKRFCWSSLCGIAVGLMLLEQQDVGLLFGTALGPYAIFRLCARELKKLSAWLLTLLPIALFGLMISSESLLAIHKTTITQATAVQDQGSENKWNFVTQWSLVPSESIELVAPGFMGWKTGDPVAPYWGKCGQSAEWEAEKRGFRNFRLDTPYLGILPVLLSLLACWYAFSPSRGGTKNCAGVIRFWAVFSIIALLLAGGKYSFLYKLFYQLPLLSNIRAPVKYLHILSIVVGILSAYGVDSLLLKDGQREARLKVAFRISLSSLVVFLAGWLVVVLFSSQINEDLAANEWGDQVFAIMKRMRGSLAYVWISISVLIGVLVLLKKKSAWPAVFVLCAMVVVDSVYVSSKYFSSESISNLKKGNPVINYLKANQGNGRVFTFDRGGIYNRWIGVDFRYHGIESFWFFQAPRLSQEYSDYLQGFNKNFMALLQASSIKYATASVGIQKRLPAEYFKPVMYYRFVLNRDRSIGVVQLQSPERDNDQVLLELTKTLPRFSLFHGWEKIAQSKMNGAIASGKINLLEKVLVDADIPASQSVGFDAVEPVEKDTNSVKLKINAMNEGILLFSQRHQPQWKAWLDGKEVPIYRCNAMSMGIHVPKGEHELVFKCSDPAWGRILLALAMVVGGIMVCFLVHDSMSKSKEAIT